MINLIRWWWKRDSESATCVCIEMSVYMSDSRVRDMAEYFKAVLDNRKTKETTT